MQDTMDDMTMDLFDLGTPDTPPAAPEPEYLRLVELALADAGRKGALKALEPELKDRLAVAAAVVAKSKLAAYDRAKAGELPDTIGWVTAQPDLAAAIALLHSSFVDVNFIPMAGRAAP